MAQATTRMRLGTCVTNPATREPSVTASSPLTRTRVRMSSKMGSRSFVASGAMQGTVGSASAREREEERIALCVHLDAAARYVFLVNGARLEAYRSITAAGTDNIWNMHYYRNSAVLKAGDVVLMELPSYTGAITAFGVVSPAT